MFNTFCKNHPTLSIGVAIALIVAVCIGLNAVATAWQINLIKTFW